MNILGNLFNYAYEKYQGPEGTAQSSLTKAEALSDSINKVAGTSINKTNIGQIEKEVTSLKAKLHEVQQKLEGLQNQENVPAPTRIKIMELLNGKRIFFSEKLLEQKQKFVEIDKAIFTQQEKTAQLKAKYHQKIVELNGILELKPDDHDAINLIKKFNADIKQLEKESRQIITNLIDQKANIITPAEYQKAKVQTVWNHQQDQFSGDAGDSDEPTEVVSEQEYKAQGRGRWDYWQNQGKGVDQSETPPRPSAPPFDDRK
ncbi:MAG: hypothetical protein JWO53_1251 [Chlamydiia bacterium]|nr:hypothetical protein [Chlamydiia bacterium]